MTTSTLVWAAPDERLFGVVPQYSPQASAQYWQPLLEHLTQAADVPLRFATASRISQFEDRVLAGEYDLIYLNPLMYWQARAAVGYRALARDNKSTRGVLVVRQNGPHRLADLKDKPLAFPAPTAVATILLRRALQAEGVRYEFGYLGTHESVYRAVAAGQYVAGAGVEHTLAQLPPDVRAQLRVIHQTPPFLAHIIAVHPRVPDEIATRLQAALLRLHAHESTRPLLKTLGFERLVAVEPRDFEGLADVRYPTPVRSIAVHVIPRLSEADTRLHMLPFAAYVRQRLGIELTLHTYASPAAFERALKAETGPMLVNANPTQALALTDHGYEVLAQQLPSNPTQGTQGVLLVRADSPYHRITDLRGKRIAFGGGANAFFASIVPRVLLKRAGLQGQYIDVSDAGDGPVAQVLQRLDGGDVDAVGIGTPALQNKRLRERYIEGRMRVLARSEALPGLAWLASRAVDADTRMALRHLLLTFGADAPGHAELVASGTDRLVPADNTTYAPVARYLKELTEP